MKTHTEGRFFSETGGSLPKKSKNIEHKLKLSNLSTFDGFNYQFEQFMGAFATYELAYQATEDMHFNRYKYRKYTGSKSFFNCRYRKMKVAK